MVQLQLSAQETGRNSALPWEHADALETGCGRMRWEARRTNQNVGPEHLGPNQLGKFEGEESVSPVMYLRMGKGGSACERPW